MFGGQSALAKETNRRRTFFSQLPLHYGDFIAKVQLAPVSPDLTGLTGKTVDIARPDVLGELVVDNFRTNTSVWEFSAQLCADLKTMPIDDPTKRWDEALSPLHRGAVSGWRAAHAGWAEVLTRNSLARRLVACRLIFALILLCLVVVDVPELAVQDRPRQGRSHAVGQDDDPVLLEEPVTYP